MFHVEHPRSCSATLAARPPTVSTATRLRWVVSPEDLVLAWPKNVPLICFYSALAPEKRAEQWSRWSIFAPNRAASTLTLAELDQFSTEDARIEAVRAFLDREFIATCALNSETSVAWGCTDTEFDTAGAGQSRPNQLPAAPFSAMFFAYELGQILEPRVGARANAGHLSSLPLITAIRVPAAFVHDRVTDQWSAVAADEDSRRELALIGDRIESEMIAPTHAALANYTLKPLRSRSGREAYERAVGTAVELIHAGDAFQVNLAHQLEGEFSGSPRGLFVGLVRSGAPWFGSYAELAGKGSDGQTTVLSISPELFLEFDPVTRRVTTRPIKGTRPEAASAQELFDAPKDRAELNMIVDLMRNDLGRVCEFGSVRVDEARAIETHASGTYGGRGAARTGETVGNSGVRHAVATISGTLAPTRTLSDLLLAAFPGGSITGAPKVRAMQIIQSLESVDRGLYCGSIGLLDGSGRFTASIAIRTATISGNVLTFPVGAGIVADSDPASEWEETLHKAAAITRLTRD